MAIYPPPPPYFGRTSPSHPPLHGAPPAATRARHLALPRATSQPSTPPASLPRPLVAFYGSISPQKAGPPFWHEGSPPRLHPSGPTSMCAGLAISPAKRPPLGARGSHQTCRPRHLARETAIAARRGHPHTRRPRHLARRNGRGAEAPTATRARSLARPRCGRQPQMSPDSPTRSTAAVYRARARPRRSRHLARRSRKLQC